MTIKSQNGLPAVTLILAGLLIFTLGIADTYTFIDEVYFADPAINFLQGRGYVTTAWLVTRQFETHVSTAPAYSLLLILWLKLWGISQTAVRALPAVLALGSAWVFWRACLRAGWIKSGRAGAILIGVVILDYGYAFSYTCGRPDALSALLVAAMFYFSTLQNRRTAWVAVGAIALLLPFVQWSCVIYVFLLSLALLLIFRKKALPGLLVVGAGMAAGLLVQRAVYVHFGLWDTWMNTIKSEGAESLIQRIGYRMTWDALLHNHKNTIPKDFSALAVLAGLAWVYIRSKRLHRPAGVRLAKSAWIIAIIVSTGMYLLGKFPSYYGWMLGFPLAAILGSYFDQAWPEGRREAKTAALIAALAGGVGLPLQIGLASYDWKDRNPAAVSAWLSQKINRDDVVFCDYPFYYIAKERAKVVFTGRYFNLLTQEETSRISLAIVGRNGSEWQQPKYFSDNASVIGNWKPMRPGILGNNWEFGFLSSPNYSCTVYRLKAPVNP
jgi:hypothetical protein